MKKCWEHKELDTLDWNEWEEMLVEEGILDDYINDIEPYDYGYELCEECDKLVQVE